MKLIKRLLYKGGLKLKLISFVFISIILAISIQNIFAIPFIESYIERKAFEVSTTTIERISDFSSFALLERTYENRLSLNDAIEKIKDSRIDGLMGISIYQRQKNGKKSDFEYIAGFGDIVRSLPIEQELVQKLSKANSEEVSFDTYLIKTPNGLIETYRFVRPIIYKYKNKNILLGFSILYYDKRAISNVIDKVLDYLYTITTIILLLSTLFVYFIGVRLTRPLLEITDAATEIANGNLDVHLDIKTNDEVENLACHFNEMVDELKQKDKMQKFVSDSTMNMIKSNEDRHLKLGGEYRVLCFLFCDIRNFTSLSEKISPEEVIDIVNFYLDIQARVVKANGGEIDKFIGDEIMASFSGEDGSYRAIKSAIEIQKEIAKENKKREAAHETICNVGIGINRGEVIVGNVGYNDHMDFTAIGLAVNITSRLCSSAKAKEIIIDKNTFDLSGCRYAVKPYKPLTLKGISYKVAAYSIIIEDEENDAK